MSKKLTKYAAREQECTGQKETGNIGSFLLYFDYYFYHIWELCIIAKTNLKHKKQKNMKKNRN